MSCRDLITWQDTKIISDIMTSSNGNISALLALCAGNSLVNGEFPSQRPVMWSFDVFFDLHQDKWLSKQSRRQWFETPSCSLWRPCNTISGCLETCLFIYSGSSLSLRKKKSRKVWLYHFKNSKSYVLLVWNSSLTSVFVFCVKHLSSRFIHGLLLWPLSELMYRQFSNIRCT